jgi:hypothetical protein
MLTTDVTWASSDSSVATITNLPGSAGVVPLRACLDHDDSVVSRDLTSFSPQSRNPPTFSRHFCSEISVQL